jgi:hypothetical protein
LEHVDDASFKSVSRLFSCKFATDITMRLGFSAAQIGDLFLFINVHMQYSTFITYPQKVQMINNGNAK